MDQNRPFHSALLVLSVAWLAGCSLDTKKTSTEPEMPPEIAVETKAFVAEAGRLVFETNDSTQRGLSYWAYTSSTTSGSFSYEVELTKTGGQAGGAFGIIFQRQNKDNFWFVYIDIQGAYCLGKRSSGVNHFVTSAGSSTFVPSAALRTGYGIENTLTVTFDGTNAYALVINGTSQLNFTDTTDTGPVYTGGQLGLAVGVLSSETFPEVPVSVSFEILSPTGLTWS